MRIYDINVFRVVILKIVCTIIFIQFFIGQLYADVINVPDDFETIREAVENAADDDTIMVAAGVHEGAAGMISEPQNLTIIGTADMRTIWRQRDRFDRDDDDAILLDNGNAINIENMIVEDFDYFLFCGEDVTITVTNCVNRTSFGIYTYERAAVRIVDSVFENSEDTFFGVSIRPEGDLYIKGCVFINHHSSIDFANSSGIIENNLIINSSTGLTVLYPEEGGDRQLPVISNNIFANCDFAVSLADYQIEDVDQYDPSNYMIYNYNVQWNNEVDFGLFLYEPDVEDVYYWNHQGEFEPEPGEGLIAENPLFVDADEGDYNLQEDSPCIDSGDPDSPEDPDGTRADIGPYYFDQRQFDEQTVDLPEGWEIISLSLRPEDNDPRVILQELVNGDNLLLFKDAFGRFFAPEFDFIDIPFWDRTHGYLIKSREATELTVTGQLIPAETPIDLLEGWNMIAYFVEDNLEAEDAFAGIMDYLLMAKDGAGHFMTVEPPFSNLEALEAGRGYLVKVSEDCTLRYVE